MPRRRLLYLDFETYYDSEYSLSQMTVPEYILDSRYETILCSVAEDQEPAHVIDGPDFPEFLLQYNPAETTTVTFNSLFDNCILAWRYGFVPATMIDVMGMARALRGHLLPSVSLRNVNILLGSREKGFEIENVRGMKRNGIIASGRWPKFCEYANTDVESMREDFLKLYPEFPWGERRILDMVLRAAVIPRFHVDVPMLEAHLEELRKVKDRLVAEAGITDRSELQSAVKFKALLESRGVDVEMKLSPSRNMVPAFAKTDEFMNNLLEHHDPVVAALAAARMGVKSTIEETRTEKLIRIGKLPWHQYENGQPRLYLGGGTLPVPLRYSGAHTHRLSGDWGINLQNLPSGRGDTKGSKLRKSLIAPPGHKVVKIDLSQIEARITAWLCGEETLLDQFANDKDPYSQLGCQIFGITMQELEARPGGKKESLERFIGKSGVLGLGFGCGASKFYTMVLRMARAMKMDMKKLLEVWTEDLAQKAVDTYRAVNSRTRFTWGLLDRHLLDVWASTVYRSVKFGPCKIEPGAVELPNGMYVRYNVKSRTPGELTYQYGRFTYPIYGSKFLENIVQALARVIIMSAAIRLSDRGYLFALQEHDALAFIVPDSDVENARKIIYEEVTRRPSWGERLPLAADISHAQSYGG